MRKAVREAGSRESALGQARGGRQAAPWLGPRCAGPLGPSGAWEVFPLVQGDGPGPARPAAPFPCRPPVRRPGGWMTSGPGRPLGPSEPPRSARRGCRSSSVPVATRKETHLQAPPACPQGWRAKRKGARGKGEEEACWPPPTRLLRSAVREPPGTQGPVSAPFVPEPGRAWWRGCDGRDSEGQAWSAVCVQ